MATFSLFDAWLVLEVLNFLVIKIHKYKTEYTSAKQVQKIKSSIKAMQAGFKIIFLSRLNLEKNNMKKKRAHFYCQIQPAPSEALILA